MSLSEQEFNESSPMEVPESAIDDQNDNLEEDQNQTIDNELDDLPMEVLVERKKRYIEEMKLEKAQEVDRLIKEKNTQEKTKYIPKIEDYLLSKIEELHQSYKQNCDNYKAQAHENEMEIRENGDNLFIETRSNHIAQLTYYEKLRALKLIHLKKKPVPKAIEYENRSKKCAYRNDYNQAFYFRDLAEKEKEKTFLARKADLENTLHIIKTKLLESMKSEMQVIADKIQSQLDKNNSILERNLDLQLKTFKIQAQEEVQKAINAMCTLYKDHDTRVSLKNEINDLVTIKLNELMDVKILLSPEVSPRAKSSLSNKQSESPTKSLTNASFRKSKEDTSQFDSVPQSIEEEESSLGNSDLGIGLPLIETKEEEENNNDDEIGLNLDDLSNNENGSIQLDYGKNEIEQNNENEPNIAIDPIIEIDHNNEIEQATENQNNQSDASLNDTPQVNNEEQQNDDTQVNNDEPPQEESNTTNNEKATISAKPSSGFDITSLSQLLSNSQKKETPQNEVDFDLNNGDGQGENFESLLNQLLD